MNLLYFDTLPSTNLYLKENYQTLEHLTAVVAKHQTAGRGRLGRDWCDSDDLLMSILLKNDLDSNYLDSLSLVICATIYNVLSKYTDGLEIKWPNDILYKGKKICGILLESVISNHVECLIIGFGININHYDFPYELKNKATSLSIINEKTYDVKKIAQEVLIAFTNDFEKYLQGNKEYLTICKNNSCLIGKKIKYQENEKEQEAEVVDILDNGYILLKINNELVEKRCGEITLHNNFY